MTLHVWLYQSGKIYVPNQKQLSLSEAAELAYQFHANGEFEKAAGIYNQILSVNPSNTDVIYNLGVVQLQAGNFLVAIKLLEKVAKEHPSYVGVHFNLGCAYHSATQYESAIDRFKRSISGDSTHAPAYFLLGDAYKATGKIDDAFRSYRSAISIDANSADAYNRLGMLFKDQGDLKQAVECYRQAISLNDRYAEAHNNLGNTLAQLDQVDDAIECFKKAVAIKPGFAIAQNNIANALSDKGMVAEALSHYVMAIQANPDFITAIQNFTLFIRGKRFTASNSEENIQIKQVLVQCLKRNDIEHSYLLGASIGALFDVTTLQLVQCYLGDESDDRGIFLPQNRALVELLLDELFITLLQKTIVSDPQVELFLTKVRRQFLEQIFSVDYSATDFSRFASFTTALAQQMYWNEFVYIETQGEKVSLGELVELIKISQDTSEKTQLIGLLSCYQPLHQHDFIASEALRLNQFVTIEGFNELVEVQLLQPQTERQIAASKFKSCGQIGNEVSKKVRGQYEDNPYPRWISLFKEAAEPLADRIGREISPNNLAVGSSVNAPNILIAGCGTGRQPIACAQSIKGASVVAVDLSLTSLSYAKRKTDELGITNIEFIQSDILELTELGRKFDVIECIGVLHHMEKPLQGWKTLVDLLSPKGFMKIGLYSEHARKSVVAARELVKSKKYEATKDDIRQCRRDIFALPETNVIKGVMDFADFYSMSSMRDLVFHVQEHRFTIPEITSALADLGLKFLGFNSNKDLKRLYASNFKDDVDGTNLENWDCLEKQHPHIFQEMYQFWVQKI